MRISIWQEFSSNHSSYFTVIGRFATEEEAKTVAERLLQWISEIGKDHRKPAETELKISQEYNLEWYKEGMSWNGWPDDYSEVVRRTRNDVAFICPQETYDRPTPFVGLMWKLGARTVDFSEGEQDYLCCYLTCEAPDEETAKAFYDHTLIYLKHDLHNGIFEPLWGNKKEKGGHTLTFGKIWQEGKQLKMRFQFFEMGYGIHALVNYLEQNGYTNIEYSFFHDREWTTS